MTTEKAPSKQAMEVAEELHVPCSCVDDETHIRVIAEALDEYAVDSMPATTALAVRFGAERDALRARNVALVAALQNIALEASDLIHDNGVEQLARAALAADAKAGEDAHA